jgi:hypothetical protein
MSTWIKLLPLELDSIKDSDIIEPDWEVQSGDCIVGEMSYTMKRLFTLSRILEKEADQLMLTRKYCANKEMKLELEAKINQYRTKAEFVKLAAWISVKDELGLWHKNVGVRFGFKVVTFEAQDDADNMLRGMLGM